jgi:hypothetical protein
LWYDESGIPGVHPDFADVEAVVKRIEKSTELYHWKQEDLVTRRRLVFRDLSELCEQADLVWEEFQAAKSAAKLTQWTHLVARIALATDHYAENSAVAKCALLGLRTTSRSAQKALELS